MRQNNFFTIFFLLSISIGLSSNKTIFAQSGITTPGQTSFNYSYAQYPNNSFMYSPSWQFSIPDKGYILFDVQAGDQIDIGLNTATDTSTGSYDYDIMIGTVGNWMIMLNDQGSYSGDPNASYADTTGNGILSATTPQSFWITLNNNVIAVGQGRDITQGQLISWDLTQIQDSNGNLIPPASGIRYFTFSSVTDAYFTNIQFGSDLTQGSTSIVTTAAPNPRRGRIVNSKQRFSMLAERNKHLPMSKSKALAIRKKGLSNPTTKAPVPVHQTQPSSIPGKKPMVRH